MNNFFFSAWRRWQWLRLLWPEPRRSGPEVPGVVFLRPEVAVQRHQPRGGRNPPNIGGRNLRNFGANPRNCCWNPRNLGGSYPPRDHPERDAAAGRRLARLPTELFTATESVPEPWEGHSDVTGQPGQPRRPLAGQPGRVGAPSWAWPCTGPPEIRAGPPPPARGVRPAPARGDYPEPRHRQKGRRRPGHLLLRGRGIGLLLVSVDYINQPINQEINQLELIQSINNVTAQLDSIYSVINRTVNDRLSLLLIYSVFS